ncbi:MAG: HAMP domain-containing sensor histidine kinase, partial [Desulfuromusa sp.]|nr:HAMP domain-containing sensor histidine kinase [Desulfuromusa sp.]
IHLQAFKEAEYLVVRVKDTGTGISIQNLGKIFDPFFTTKEKGTGFGLSVALQVVKSCGGKIHVDSSPGAGACFSIELPLFPDSVH